MVPTVVAKVVFLCLTVKRTSLIPEVIIKITFVINEVLKIRWTSFEQSNITSEARELKIFERKHLEIFNFTA
jgi:hypothetical protein